ncbi:dUTP diphosphatase [Candidatus Similichlamydia laticola]|uniref:dUTP diphosphatase n=1 Tax=Candidatus Similichlamydia laticola TaxID=2170265 RepID=A0A369K9R9_9BACT|nr:dUTP diphosphatase [Candidatus Similichlamydia laticola]RDB31349.1 Deoxyuridine 5'-triphosphate nucleotidohydrolase [Candidatus Similichlamydia laticola]
MVQSSKNIWLDPGETQLVHTGFFFDLPETCSILVFSYPEVVLQKGLVIANAPGTIDSDYRGELCGIMTNLSGKKIQLLAGEVFALGLREEVHQMHSPVEIEENIIQFKLSRSAHRPSYQTDGAAGFDLHAATEENITIRPGDMKIIDTGLQVSLSEGFHMQVRSRSGLALKSGIVVLGSPLILIGKQQTLKIPLYNLGKEPFLVTPGMRIAQAVCLETQILNCSATDKLSLTKRGLGGFGSTGA